MCVRVYVCEWLQYCFVHNRLYVMNRNKLKIHMIPLSGHLIFKNRVKNVHLEDIYSKDVCKHVTYNKWGGLTVIIYHSVWFSWHNLLNLSI